MDALITIAARGGSKGLPNKAILPMNGKPLIRWTVDQARAWGRGAIVVSSDSERILRAADCGMTPLLRPKELAGDHTGKLDVLRHATEYMEHVNGGKYSIVIDLDVTNPLRTPEDIENCYQQFIKVVPDSLISVTKGRRNPWFNMVTVNKQGRAALACGPGRILKRRQDAPEVFDLNCCIYVYRRDWLVDPKHISPMQGDCRVYIMEDWQFIDIDSAFDFDISAFLMKEYLYG